MEIVRGSDVSDKGWKELEEIFFVTSSIQEFSSSESKAKFKYKYFGFYQEKYLDYFLALKKDDQYLGYVCGAPSTQEDPVFLESHLYYSVFKDELKKFPAHLHINIHSELRGQGAGALLINEFIQTLKLDRVKALHIITSPEARNRRFYNRCGFDFEQEAMYQGTPLLFMGKVILIS